MSDIRVVTSPNPNLVDGAMPSIMNDTDDGSWDDWDSDDDDNTPDDIQILITIPQDGGMPSVSDLDDDWIDGAMPSIDDGAMPSMDGAMPGMDDGADSVDDRIGI